MLVQLTPGRKKTAPHSVYPLVKTPSLKDARSRLYGCCTPPYPDRRCARLDGPPQIPSTTNLAHRGAGCPSCAGLIWTCGHQERSAVRLDPPGPGGAGPGGTAGRGRDLPRLPYYRFRRGYIAAHPAPGKLARLQENAMAKDSPPGSVQLGKYGTWTSITDGPPPKYSCALIVSRCRLWRTRIASHSVLSVTLRSA